MSSYQTLTSPQTLLGTALSEAHEKLLLALERYGLHGSVCSNGTYTDFY